MVCCGMRREHSHVFQQALEVLINQSKNRLAKSCSKFGEPWVIALGSVGFVDDQPKTHQKSSLSPQVSNAAVGPTGALDHLYSADFCRGEEEIENDRHKMM